MWFLILLAFLHFANVSAAEEEVPVYINTRLLRMPDAEAYEVERVASKYEFSNKKKVKWFAQQTRQRRFVYDRQQSLLFNDPRWKDQEWYLNPSDGKGMNVYQAWQQGFTGKGVVVAVVDDGLQQSHPDLTDNFDPSVSIDLVDLDNNTDPVGENAGHGNRCGGVIAAVANNGRCGVGVAFNAMIGGIRLFSDDSPTDAMEALALNHSSQRIDIYSCSWGPSDTGWAMDGPKEKTRHQLEWGTKYGRRGKGSIYVFASGNGGRNYDTCAYNGYVNDIHTIAISGVNKDGSVPGYAEMCAGVMASTFSRDNVNDIVTTDRNGACTSTFSYSSAAAAMASGILALALEANQNLTWRDVQHLIVHSSRPDIPRAEDWKKNGAGRWVSNYFGFGLMDAAALVKNSRSWRLVPPQVRCVISQKAVNKAIPQTESTEVAVTVSERNCGESNSIQYLEHVVVIIRVKFDRRGYLEGYLTSPNGTESYILPFRANDVLAQNFDDWPILSLHFWGENPKGTWRLRFKNHFPKHSFTGTLFNWSLVLYGTAGDPLGSNRHVTTPYTKATPIAKSTTFVSSGVTTSAPKKASGLSSTEIALICSSLALLVIVVVVLCVLVKFGIISCRKDPLVIKPLADDNGPEQGELTQRPSKSDTHV